MTPDPNKRLTIDTNDVRLDKRLSTKFPYSRSFFEHLFKRKAIKVNGKIAKKSLKTIAGQRVEIESLERFVDGGILDEAPAIELPVRHETDDYIILYKSKGVLSHPNSIRDVAQPSVVGFLYHRYKDLPSIGNFIRAGLIHRLDRETDGLMLAAKNEAGMAYFKSLFVQKSEADAIEDKERIPLKKYYRALCDVTPEGQEFLEGIESYPHIIDANVIPRTPFPIVKRGLTKVLNISPEGEGRVVVSLEILTGRTHQIRYHLSEAGLPIVGDYLYHPDHNEDEDLGLTACRLEFTDNTGEKIVCEVD